jgi:outer membrane protein TolC
LPVPPAPSAAWSASDPAITVAEIRLDWWRELGSDELDALVTRALAANHDLAAADANLRAARALAGEARRARGVRGGANAGIERRRESAQGQPPEFILPQPFADQTIAAVGVDFAWEIDLAGGNAANARAAGAEATAALWQRRQTEAAVAAQVVRAWLDLARAESLAALMRQRLDAIDRMLALGKAQVRHGAARAADFAPLEVVRAGVQWLLLAHRL